MLSIIIIIIIIGIILVIIIVVVVAITVSRDFMFYLTAGLRGGMDGDAPVQFGDTPVGRFLNSCRFAYPHQPIQKLSP
eukprot:4444571-Pyramimonas_sp.AAC.1